MCAVGRAGAPGGEPIDIPVLAEEVGIAPKPLSRINGDLSVRMPMIMMLPNKNKMIEIICK